MSPDEMYRPAGGRLWRPCRTSACSTGAMLYYNNTNIITMSNADADTDTDYDAILDPYHTIPCHAMLYHAIPYHAIPCHTIPYHAILLHTTPYHLSPILL